MPITYTTYTVNAGTTTATPSIMTTPQVITRVGNLVTGYFKLDPDWAQLYTNSNTSTHKLVGVSDLFGFNSVRIGVRRSSTATNGLVAVNYRHVNNVFSYPALKRISNPNQNLILAYNTNYFFKIYQSAANWVLEIWNGARNTMLSSATGALTISTTGRRIQGTYVEVGSAPSPWRLRTYIQLTKVV